MSRSRSPSPARSPSSSRSRSASPRRNSPDPAAEACPFLIRVFVTKNGHTPLIDFDDGKFPLSDERHSTPTSLVQQLYSVFPAPYRSPAARYTFKHVYVDASERGLYRGKELVSFSGRDFVATVQPAAPSANGDSSRNGHGHSHSDVAMDRELDDVAPAPARRGRVVEEKTLDAYGFITGDLVSIAIHVPEPRGAGGGAGPSGAVTSIRGAARDRDRERERERGPGGRDRDRDVRARDDDRRAGGGWGRGSAPLPPQGFRKTGERDYERGGAPAGSWRGGAPRGAVGSRGEGGGGRRGAGGGRGDWRRSQSPDDRQRRESWASRTRD